MIIIGITGTLAAGKGCISKFLVDKKGFKHFSMRDFLTQEVKKAKQPVTRKSLVDMGNLLRKKHGPSYTAETLYKKAKKYGRNSIIESLRNPGEIEALRKKANFYLLAIDADPGVRYKRAHLRGSVTDHITFKQFLAQEKKEMKTKDPNKQNLGKCIQMADYKIENNATMKKLHEAVDAILQKIS